MGTEVDHRDRPKKAFSGAKRDRNERGHVHRSNEVAIAWLVEQFLQRAVVEVAMDFGFARLEHTFRASISGLARWKLLRQRSQFRVVAGIGMCSSYGTQ